MISTGWKVGTFLLTWEVASQAKLTDLRLTCATQCQYYTLSYYSEHKTDISLIVENLEDIISIKQWSN